MAFSDRAFGLIQDGPPPATPPLLSKEGYRSAKLILLFLVEIPV
jgi:hypothetical protein